MLCGLEGQIWATKSLQYSSIRTGDAKALEANSFTFSEPQMCCYCSRVETQREAAFDFPVVLFRRRPPCW